MTGIDLRATGPWAATGQEAARATAPLRVAVLGAHGYAGQEFLRLARAHPRVEIVGLCVRENADRPALATMPGADRDEAPPALWSLAELGAALAENGCDALVACLPHGVFGTLAREHPGLGRARQIVDLSSDHRDGNGGFLYGLPELFRSEIAGASRIANPGCYATAAILALAPAAAAGWLDGPVAISALSGASGAGRAASLRTSFVEAEGGAWIYRAGAEHPHLPEIARTLARVAVASPPLGFTPQVAPMARGILLTAYAPLARGISGDEARARYQERYGNESFVRLLPSGEWPETRAVRQSNRCDLAVTTLHGGRTLLVTAALDNLVKGAAGQAIQNLNLMNGWPETTGLAREGIPW